MFESLKLKSISFKDFLFCANPSIRVHFYHLSSEVRKLRSFLYVISFINVDEILTNIVLPEYSFVTNKHRIQRKRQLYK